MSAPTHAAAAVRCKKSADGWMMPSAPAPPAAWPPHASIPTRPAAIATAATLSQIIVGRLRFDVSVTANIAASSPERIARISQARPNSVCSRTTQRKSSEKTSATGRSPIDAATRMNHAAPDAAVITRPTHAKQASCLCTAAGRRASSPALRNAGSAMNTRKKTTPATVIVAA